MQGGLRWKSGASAPRKGIGKETPFRAPQAVAKHEAERPKKDSSAFSPSKTFN